MNKPEKIEEVESICPKCAGRGIVPNGHITKKGKKCVKCEGQGQVVIWRKVVDN